MTKALISTYLEWVQNGTVKLIVLEGQGSKAFCAGGDAAAVVQAILRGEVLWAVDRARDIYALMYLVSQCGMPQVAIMDGITMGAGAALACHGPFQVATERTQLSMPECVLGFFVDVGASVFLNRLPPGVGLFLALTGYQLQGAEVLRVGLATHFVPSDKVGPLREALAAEAPAEHAHIARCIRRFEAVGRVDESRMTAILDIAASCFSGSAAASVGSILEALHSAIAPHPQLRREALQRMQRASPLSLSLTHRVLQTGKALSPRQCLEMDMRVTAHCGSGASDFVEGVRALLIDKTGRPRWRHASVHDIPQEEVDGYFQPIDFCDELGATLAPIDVALQRSAKRKHASKL